MSYPSYSMIKKVLLLETLTGVFFLMRESSTFKIWEWGGISWVRRVGLGHNLHNAKVFTLLAHERMGYFPY